MTNLSFGTLVQAADFGSPGGSVPANLDAITQTLRQDPYDLELLISYGTCEGGSRKHSPMPASAASVWQPPGGSAQAGLRVHVCTPLPFRSGLHGR